MSEEIDNLLDTIKQSMAEKIGIQYPIYKKTSCIDPEIAKAIGFLDGYVKYLCKDEKKKKFLTETLIPFLENYGASIWQKSEISHLGFKLAERKKSFSLRGASFGKKTATGNK